MSPVALRTARFDSGQAPARFVRACAALPLLILLVGLDASAYVLKVDSTGASVRWKDEARLIVDARLEERLGTPGAAEAVARSVASFVAEGIAVSVEAGEVSGVGYAFEEGAENRSEIVVPDEWAFDENALAVTVVTVNARTHEILDADIALNAQHRRFGIVADPERGRSEGIDDVQNTLTHELGHALGLAHNAELVDVVMYPSAVRGEIHKRELSPDDRAGLAFLYGLDAPAAGDDTDLPPGCSAGGGSPLLLGGLGVLLLRLRRSRREATS